MSSRPRPDSRGWGKPDDLVGLAGWLPVRVDSEAGGVPPRRIASRPLLVPAAALLAALLLALGPAGLPAAVGSEQQGLQRDVDALHGLGITGVIARLDAPEATHIARAGVADLGSRQPVAPDPYLRIGSTTKTFVAVVVLQLVGEGRMSLDDTVHRWLPGVVAGNGNDGRTVTVRQLLQHTSGLHDYTEDLIPRYLTPQDYRRERWRTRTPEELVAIAMAHPPGPRDWAYSNTNYVVAGMLIEAVTGRTWDREVRERIVRPLGLWHTRTPGTWPFLPDPHAHNYQQFTSGGPVTDTTVAIRALDSGADGSMISTPAEVNRFLQATLDGRLLRPAQREQLKDIVALPDGSGYPPGSGDGLGLFHRPLSCGGGYWSHGGNGFGYEMRPAITEDGHRIVTVAVFLPCLRLGHRRTPYHRTRQARRQCPLPRQCAPIANQRRVRVLPRFVRGPGNGVPPSR